VKSFIFILTMIAFCTQLFAESNYSTDDDYYKSTPSLRFQKVKDKYIVRLWSNDNNSYEVKKRRRIIFIINQNDSVFLPSSLIQSEVNRWDNESYSATNYFELRDKSLLLDKTITKVLVQKDDGSFETYNIKPEYREDFKKDLKRNLLLADISYKDDGISVWWIVVGVLIILVLVVFFMSKKTAIPDNNKHKTTNDKKKDEIKPIEDSPKTLIDQGQYYYICKYSKELQKLFKKMSEDKKFFSSVNDLYVSAGEGEITYSDSLYIHLRSYFIKDLQHCFDEIGYSFHYTTRTEIGQCLYVICSALEIIPSIANVSYDFFNERMTKVSSKEITEERESLDYWEEVGTIDFQLKIEDEFIIPSLLLLCNGKYDDLRHYRILLNKLITILAQVNDENKEQKLALLERIKASIEQMSEKELNNLIGLQPVKEEVQTLSNFIAMRQKRKEMGLTVPEVSYHLVFTGNPGTGKTTVARILAGIFRDKGILKKGHLVETDRSGLVAEYVGQTAVKTNKIIDKALDGVLFIDEAYSLIAQGEDFGQEAIATLLKRMEDDRDRLIVILAGYTKEMEDFINSNPGLRSRFNRYIFFPDYSAEELSEVFFSITKKQEYTMKEEVKQYIRDRLQDVVNDKPKDFGNARYVRNLFERVVQAQANRLAKESNLSKDMLTEIRIEDIEKSLSI